MRLFMLTTAMIGLLAIPSVGQAGRNAVGPAGFDDYGSAPFDSNRQTTFGRRLRGGYGRNGFAPIWGPLWGAQALTPAAGKGYDIRPMGSYVKSPYVLPEMGPPVP